MYTPSLRGLGSSAVAWTFTSLRTRVARHPRNMNHEPEPSRGLPDGHRRESCCPPSLHRSAAPVRRVARTANECALLRAPQPGSGRPYYVNMMTGQSSWTPPQGASAVSTPAAQPPPSASSRGLDPGGIPTLVLVSPSACKLRSPPLAIRGRRSVRRGVCPAPHAVLLCCRLSPTL